MVIYIVKWSFIYIVLIFLLHNLYLFFQNNLTSTKIKDYYNTYNSYNNNNNNNNKYNSNTETDKTKINIKTNETSSVTNKIQISSTSLEELSNYSELANNNNELINNELINNEFTNYNNGLTNDMKSELDDFFNKLKL